MIVCSYALYQIMMYSLEDGECGACRMITPRSPCLSRTGVAVPEL